MRDIPGFNGYYKIDERGNVMSYYKENARWLTPTLDNKGYYRVNLTKDGKSKKHRIHRLVLLTYRGPSDLQCNHKNGNKRDNRLTNLDYCTNRENQIHALEVLKRKVARGTRTSTAKLTEEQVKEIRRDYKPYKVSSPKLAKKYGVSHPVILAIIKRKTWTHI